MLIAHLSDLHLRDSDDEVWLEHQLDRIVARSPDHLAITGDLLDRWNPALLERVLDALARRGLAEASRTTILHGNHDLASSGGHPRRGADLWRIALRFWDPPPIVAARQRRFRQLVAARAPDVVRQAPWMKRVNGGGRIAVVDSVPAFWLPVRVAGRTLIVKHAIGCIAESQSRWLASQPADAAPLIVLLHHYPLPVAPFRWTPDRAEGRAARALRALEAVEVAMEIKTSDRERFWDAAVDAGVRLVLCGHVHRARLERHRGIAVGLNGQSGAAWAGRTIAWYRLSDGDVKMELEAAARLT